MPYLGILFGMVVFVVATVLAVVGLASIGVGIAWCRWKRRQIRMRKEWRYDNPYWTEAFDAGANWVEDGRPPMKPHCGRVHIPKEYLCGRPS